MSRPAGFAYSMRLTREDGTELAQRAVRPDWGPALEWARLLALRGGRASTEAFVAECDVEPVWDEDRGKPWVAGVRVSAPGPGCRVDELPLEYFAGAAVKIATGLVEEGALQDGERYRYFPLAFPLGDPTPTPAPLARVAPPRISVRDAALPPEFASQARGREEPAPDLPVLLPRRVLDQATGLTIAARGRETGGILIGHLCRDRGRGEVFAEITAQVPAAHTEASAAKLTFTAATWDGVQAAIDLRRRDEIMLGWWHSHPVVEWCKDCAPEKRRVCLFRRGFLSVDDIALHRAVFPRAYSVALLMNDVGDEPPAATLFGWRRGLVEERTFHPITETAHAAVR